MAIRAAIAAAQAAAQEGIWITYLARDPRFVDRKGNSGWPIYVGQSKDFGTRVRNHLRTSEKRASGNTSIKRRMKEILHAGHVPIFDILDRQPTRLRSLMSETNFARACRRRGYDIANQRRLQNEAGPPVTRRDIPADWLWEFSLDEAILDALKVRVHCKACGGTLSIEASWFAQLGFPPKDLRTIRDDAMWLHEPCTFCGIRGRRRVSPDIS